MKYYIYANKLNTSSILLVDFVNKNSLRIEHIEAKIIWKTKKVFSTFLLVTQFSSYLKQYLVIECKVPLG